MKVRGDRAPSNAFTLEEQPKKPGYVLVRLFENVEAFSETNDGLTISGYQYDEYTLELEDTEGLSDDILGNYASYLTEAKLKEAEEKTIPTLKERVAELEGDNSKLTTKVSGLESQVTEAQLALCDVYEQVVATQTTSTT